MNKSGLVDEVASRAGLDKTRAGHAVDALLAAIEDALRNGDSVSLLGFGTFSVGERAARTGRNPQTKGPMLIPAARIPRFRPGKSIKDAVALPAAAPAVEPAVAAPVAPAVAVKEKEPKDSKEKSGKKK